MSSNTSHVLSAHVQQEIQHRHHTMLLQLLVVV
jgi:hypothetical protein